MAGRYPLLLDEHLPRALQQALLRSGWTVVRVVDLDAELGPVLTTSRFTYAMEQSAEKEFRAARWIGAS